VFRAEAVHSQHRGPTWCFGRDALRFRPAGLRTSDCAKFQRALRAFGQLRNSRNSVPAPMARGITYMNETGLTADTTPETTSDGTRT